MTTKEDIEAIVEQLVAKIGFYTKSVLTLDEAAQYMGVSKSHLYKLTMARQVPFSKPMGKMCYFDRLEIEKWLMSNRVSTSDELEEQASAYLLKKKKK